MKKKILIAVTICILFFSLCAYAFSKPAVSENIIRLHIIANSDSETDQQVKLLVRDALLNYFHVNTNSTSKITFEEYLCKNLSVAENVANQVLTKNGIVYTSKAEYGIYEFPTRTYGNITLPAGKYYALKLSLGEAKGKNWWCVMYPALCFNEINTEATTQQNEQVTFEIKFKIAELWKYFK